MKIVRAAIVAVSLIAAAAWAPTAAQAEGPAVAMAVTSAGDGYVTVDSGGVVHAFGAVAAAGSPTGFSGTIAGVSTTGNGQGYAAISSRGQVYAYGAVRYRGNPTGFSGSIVGISVTADGQGYAAISSTGQVYAYGTVRYRANPTGFSGTITGISVTADGQGYAAISSTGQVYAYGTVRYRGNPTGFSGTITGISVTADGQGYAAVSSRAQTYAYGTVRSRGNPYDFFGTASGIAVTGDGQGYAVVTTSGQIHTYGSVGFRGDFPDVDNQNTTQHVRAARYVDWSYPSNAQIYNVDQTAYIVAKARSTYWALNWSWTDTTRSSGGYMGLQTDGQRFDNTTGDTALFSLWNANGSRGGNCARFGGEGEGLSCRLAYPIYGDGNSYRLRVWRLEADADGQWWGAWIQDSRRGDTPIGELRVPLGATDIASANDFIEYFGSRVGCDAVPQSLVNWGTPQFRAATTNGSPAFVSSLKSSCTGGTAARTTISGGIPVVHAFLGGARPGA